eukprot:m.458550 g.458550  ORF g.458550 m.458550 type:complete len:839 (-) comp56994_c1_seq2:102-2618(-)
MHASVCAMWCVVWCAVWSAAAAVTIIPLEQGAAVNISGIAGMEFSSYTFSYNQTYSSFVAVTSQLDPAAIQQWGDGQLMSVVAAQKCAVNSWGLPLIQHLPSVGQICNSSVAMHQLCPSTCDGTEHVFSLNVQSDDNVAFNMTVELVDRVLEERDEPYQVTVYTWAPVFYRLQLPADGHPLSISISGSNDTIAVMSLQNFSCPINLSPYLYNDGSIVQSFLEQATLYVDNTTLHSTNLVLVFALDPEYSDSCDESKTFLITVSAAMTTSEYVRPIMLMLAPYLSFIGVCLIVLLIERIRRVGLGEHSDFVATESTSLLRPPSKSQHEAVALTTRSAEGISRTTSIQPQESEIDNLARPDWDYLNYTFGNRLFYRSKAEAVLRVSDLARRAGVLQSRFALNFLWMLVAVAVIYAVPVIQLVESDLSRFNAGEQDLCYINFACAHPRFGLASFNNVMSNLGYIMLGLLFLAIVHRRRRVYLRTRSAEGLHDWTEIRIEDYLNQSAVESSDKESLLSPDSCRGLPRHFGLLYAIGFAMICEGFFSGFYHFCPNARNFQFDTSCMYIIAMLNILALYQRRHSDLLPTAHAAYISFAVFMAVEVVGVYFGRGSHIFYGILLVAFLILSYLGVISIYYLGIVRFRVPRLLAPFFPFALAPREDSQVGGELHDLENYAVMDCFNHPFTCGLTCTKSLRPKRLVALSFFTLLNTVVLLVGAITAPEDVSTFFLAFMVINLAAYLAVYMVMKLLHKEKPTWLTMLCGALTIAAWAPALYYFQFGLTEWSESPAVSRNGNGDCMLWDFFDAHDIWHMLSSYGLFFASLMMLVLDDNLNNVARSDIHVF